MPGAIRTPWIKKHLFYKLPFNFCDRWCERCHLTGICRVFQREQKSRKKFISQGKDPDSWECVFESLKENFGEVRKLLEKDAKKLGINLEKISRQEVPPFAEPEEYPLYCLVDRFSRKLKRAMEDLYFVLSETDLDLVEEEVGIINYYRILIQGKVYRAITSKIEEKKDKDDVTFDAMTSAFIVVNALMAISRSLKNLSKRKLAARLRKKLLSLQKVTLELVGIINLEFGLRTNRNRKN